MTNEVVEIIKYITINRVTTLDIGGELFVRYCTDTTDSTMDFAGDLISKGCSPWTIVTAEQQTTGRGTHGRNWISPKGKGLLVSIILDPPTRFESLEDLSVRTAGVLISALKECCDLPFEIKYPNDVLIRGRKVAGIMFESVSSSEKVLSLVLGMGLNVYHSSRDFKRAGLPDATSLFTEAGYAPDREHLLVSFLEHFIPMYKDIQ